MTKLGANVEPMWPKHDADWSSIFHTLPSVIGTCRLVILLTGLGGCEGRRKPELDTVGESRSEKEWLEVICCLSISTGLESSQLDFRCI